MGKYSRLAELGHILLIVTASSSKYFDCNVCGFVLKNDTWVGRQAKKGRN